MAFKIILSLLGGPLCTPGGHLFSFGQIVTTLKAGDKGTVTVVALVQVSFTSWAGLNPEHSEYILQRHTVAKF